MEFKIESVFILTKENITKIYRVGDDIAIQGIPINGYLDVYEGAITIINDEIRVECNIMQHGTNVHFFKISDIEKII